MNTRIWCILAAALIGSVNLSRIARAELPPSVYEELRAQAPEVLEVEITRVALNSRDNRDQRDISVFADAKIKKVIRSKSGLKVGQSISLRYMTFEMLSTGWAGPGPISKVKKGGRYRVYLKKAGKHFYPAARGATVENL